MTQGTKKHPSKSAALKAAKKGLRATKRAVHTHEHTSQSAALRAAKQGLPRTKLISPQRRRTARRRRSLFDVHHQA